MEQRVVEYRFTNNTLEKKHMLKSSILPCSCIESFQFGFLYHKDFREKNSYFQTSSHFYKQIRFPVIEDECRAGIRLGYPEVPSGFTGRMEFNELGRRQNMNITVWEIDKDGFSEFGYYNEKDELVVTKKFAMTQAQIQKELKGQTLRVSTIEVSKKNLPPASSYLV
ncbi:unnamed protein product [Dibothriocephalus latus]|uniref:Uncharacterized protein n=1 Tax=Dibothriocephalus latus TaxID=60516 RepID=A0A3P6Q7Q4_DIBLA|nr:unnamed protein product [Dibothriocephalus latus]